MQKMSNLPKIIILMIFVENEELPTKYDVLEFGSLIISLDPHFPY